MGLEPPEAHGQSISDGPHVAVFARQGNAANRTGRGVMSEYDSLVSCVDYALDLVLKSL